MYTLEKLCDVFQAKGVTLESPGIGIQASRFLKESGHPYRVQACMYQNEPMFMFVFEYIPVDSPTMVAYRFQESDDARAMKKVLELEDTSFVTAIY